MDNTTGKRLAQARSAAGLTQKQLALEFEIDAITVSRYERDSQPMSIDRATKFAERLRVSPAWLITGEGEGPSKPAPVEPAAPPAA
jgi:HTH-type transcriptional regulator, cell division transcriptional repressor